MDKINAMNRVNRIIRHPLWRTYVDEIERLEGERRFCRHGIDHLLHVARLAYLENLENGMQIGKEQIYAAVEVWNIQRGFPTKRRDFLCLRLSCRNAALAAGKRKKFSEPFGHTGIKMWRKRRTSAA